MEVYPAGEEPIENIHRDALVDGLRAHGHRDVLALNSPEELPKIVAEKAQDADYVICLGAGSITGWANALPADLRKLIDAKDRQAGAPS